MFGVLSRLPAPTREKLRAYLPWMLIALTILFVVVVRFRLRDMPLERDEGEYAYAGQLMLQGIPPYKLAYNMKLPGTYAAYAVLMAVFGQSASGVHLGLALVNAASIVLVFLCGRRLLNEAAGIAAAVAYGLLSMSPAVLGLQAHATHFVVLPALGGFFVLLRAAESGQLRGLFLSGLLLGLAFVMKQHGMMFGAFGFVYLAWVRARVQKEQFAWSKIRARSVRFDRMKYGRELGVFAAGLAVPYLLVCVALAISGVFPQFYFWTVQYASKYITAVPLSNRSELFRNAMNIVASPNIVSWILAGLGAILMWSDKRISTLKKVFVTGLLGASILSISIGFYFREHYFILLLPALSLLVGVAVSRGTYSLLRGQSAERFLAIPTLGLFLLSLGSILVLHGDIWFGLSPVKGSQRIYGDSLFSESVQVGEYLKTNTAPQATIAVLGSEPEIYFYSRRHSATGYIYMYPLMEQHEYALKMQEEMIGELERARPEYVVFVEVSQSWLPWPGSKQKVREWWQGYWVGNYDLVKIITIEADKDMDAKVEPPKPGSMRLFKRRAVQ
jgi:dolichyl-phosphate-mannose-protein mannosyltransferase